MAMKGSNRFHFLPLRFFAIVAVILSQQAARRRQTDRTPRLMPNTRKSTIPSEPMNRGFFQLNRALDAWFLKPLAIMYREFSPPPFQRGIHNFLNNLHTPVVLANDLLQGEMGRAGTTFSRFLVNTTLGVGGLGDPATELGWQDHSEDFGQTLAVWGLPEGPYLMLPVLGPSNPRDGVALAVDTFVLDPVAWWVRAETAIGRGSVTPAPVSLGSTSERNLTRIWRSWRRPRSTSMLRSAASTGSTATARSIRARSPAIPLDRPSTNCRRCRIFQRSRTRMLPNLNSGHQPDDDTSPARFPSPAGHRHM